MKLPIRHNSHNLEELSRRYFQNALPNNWTASRPQHDYGIDLQVDIFEGNSATGLELLVQLKASKNKSVNEYETIKLKVSTYNYLREKLQIVMLVKYNAEENEAYWMFLKDVNAPNQDCETFTIHISKENKLSQINWDNISRYIYEVTDKKLAAIRAKEQEKRLLGLQPELNDFRSPNNSNRKSSQEIAKEKGKIFKYKKLKESFFFSEQGVQRAESEVTYLFEQFNNQVEEMRDPDAGLYFELDSKNNGANRILEIVSRNIILRIDWFNNVRNSLEISRLNLWLTKNFRYFSDYGEKREIIANHKYIPNIDMTNQIGWSNNKEDSAIITSDDLADIWLGKLIESLD